MSSKIIDPSSCLEDQELVSGKNSCCHYSLTEIKFDKEKHEYVFPSYFYDDYFVDYFEDHGIELTERGKQISRVSANQITWDQLWKLKVESYSAENWITTLEQFTYATTCVALPFEMISQDNTIQWTRFKEYLTTALQNTQYPKFVKLDTVSGKDSGLSGVVNSVDEIVNLFRQSGRLQRALCQKRLSHSYPLLLLREVDSELRSSNALELRCFVRHGKLTAVSGGNELSADDKEKIEQYFVSLCKELPFQDVVVDIKFVRDGELKVIELNNFGADSPCGAGRFSWKDDFLLLYGSSEEVTYR